MKKLDEKKTIGPDGVSGYILKECKQEMVEPIHDIIKYSLTTGKIPKEWKRADIMPIFKNGVCVCVCIYLVVIYRKRAMLVLSRLQIYYYPVCF